MAGISAIVLAGFAWAGGAGTVAGEPLRLAHPARDLGMGDAQAAAGSGPGALFSNPAGLIDTRILTLHLTHIFQVAETQQEYFSWTQRLPFGPGLGAGIFWFYNGGAPRTLEDEDGNYAGQAGDYSVTFGAVSLGFAVDLKPLIGLDFLGPSAGVAVRAFGQVVDDEQALGYSTDIGLRMRPGFGFVLGAVLQNAGRRLAGAGLPRQWVGALAWESAPLFAGRDSFVAEVDVPVAVDRDAAVQCGLEYSIAFGSVAVALRGGMKQGLDVPGGAGLTAGVGFRSVSGTLAWGIDYAYIPFGALGGINAVALTMGFIPPEPQ